MNLVNLINCLISIIFVILYFYQFIYLLVSIFVKEDIIIKNNKKNKYAILICARNEEKVIGDLIDSIYKQQYDKNYYDTYVVADNCDDNTALIAKRKGAIVFERYDYINIGKGYALDYLLKKINNMNISYDGYMVFDADNILDENFIAEINNSYNLGEDIIVSYRNSKNYASNWISAGNALCFLRESNVLNKARYILGNSCLISGTGFFFSKKIYEQINGYPYHTLTEDIEFCFDIVLKDNKVYYNENAIFYDEQPFLFKESWNQRLRWCKGYLQVISLYIRRLWKCICSGNFSCFDLPCASGCAYFLSLISVTYNFIAIIVNIFLGNNIDQILFPSILNFINSYILLYFIGLITTITEYKRIKATSFKKILYTFTFPIFIFSYVPVAYAALLFKVSWKPITHNITIKNM